MDATSEEEKQSKQHDFISKVGTQTHILPLVCRESIFDGRLLIVKANTGQSLEEKCLQSCWRDC